LLVGILILESIALFAVRASKGSGGSTDGSGVPAAGSQLEAANASGPAMSGRTQSIAVDRSGNFYLADTSGNRILKIDASGRTANIAGTGSRGYSGDGGPAVSAELSSPRGVAVDSSGTVYIADSRNNVVRKVDAAGIITTVAGNGGKGYWGDGGPATSAALSAPTSLAIDGEGDLIVFDSGNGRLRMVAADETIVTVAVVPRDPPIGEPTSP
jgi:sugar lactone lactonase YvrE